MLPRIESKTLRHTRHNMTRKNFAVLYDGGAFETDDESLAEYAKELCIKGGADETDVQIYEQR